MRQFLDHHGSLRRLDPVHPVRASSPGRRRPAAGKLLPLRLPRWTGLLEGLCGEGDQRLALDLTHLRHALAVPQAREAGGFLGQGKPDPGSALSLLLRPL